MILSTIASAATIQVPADQPTIQAGINAAINGDVVLVAPGTYVENINFFGKFITVVSSEGPRITVIDGNQSGSVVSFVNGESPDTILDGFTITNGSGRTDFEGKISGGGVFSQSNSPTILNNIIMGNKVSGSGGGIQSVSSKSRISNNIIVGNTAGIYGGGIDCCHSLLDCTNNIIANNSAPEGEQYHREQFGPRGRGHLFPYPLIPYRSHQQYHRWEFGDRPYRQGRGTVLHERFFPHGNEHDPLE
jgi:hypothetical protein